MDKQEPPGERNFEPLAGILSISVKRIFEKYSPVPLSLR
jgi:hypothetical protein